MPVQREKHLEAHHPDDCCERRSAMVLRRSEQARTVAQRNGTRDMRLWTGERGENMKMGARHRRQGRNVLGRRKRRLVVLNVGLTSEGGGARASTPKRSAPGVHRPA